MILPAMQRVHEKVDFTLSFIGKYVLGLSPTFNRNFDVLTELPIDQTDRQRRRRLQARPGRVLGQHHRAMRAAALPGSEDISGFHHVPHAQL